MTGQIESERERERDDDDDDDGDDDDARIRIKVIQNGNPFEIHKTTRPIWSNTETTTHTY